MVTSLALANIVFELIQRLQADPAIRVDLQDLIESLGNWIEHEETK